MVYNVVWSLKYGEKDLTGDPWDGRTLEWALPSPVPEYNFARIPVVTARDAWWDMKQKGQTLANSLRPEDMRTIELPKNTPVPFYWDWHFSWWDLA